MHRLSLHLGIQLLLLGILGSTAAAQSSELWGHAGEQWDPTGRLPDYSYAGYHAGEEALPVLPVVADVKDFGAAGNGVTDDTQAFRNAISYAGTQGGGAVYVPPGTYVIGQILFIETDNVVLRGAGSGSGGTVLYFPNHLEQLSAGNSPWPGYNKPWNDGEGGILWVGDRDNFFEPGLGSQLTWVTGSQVRGDRQLVVGSSSGINAGDYVVLEQTDPGDQSLGLHVHNLQANPGNCVWQPQPIRWVVQVESKSGNVLTLAQPLRLDVRGAWSPKIYRYQGVREVGIEHMWLKSASHWYPGHLQEKGYNPVTFAGAVNCWLKDVTIENADNGPSFTGLTKNCTFSNIAIVGTLNAHHGFSIRENAADNLIEDFYIEPIFIHGVTVDHGPSGNVVRMGSGTDIYLDHHRDGSYENLFSDIDVGAGGYVWSSGGSSCAGPNAGARHTYWNLRASAWTKPPTPVWADIQSNLVPGQGTSKSVNNAWMEDIDDITPDDLYASQLERRLDDEVLVKTTHVAATFEDGTARPLGQYQGKDPIFTNGSLLVPDTSLARFLVPTATYDDQEIVYQTEAGLPRGAQIGVLIRAREPDWGPYGGTRVYLEGKGGNVQEAQYVVARLEDQNGLFRESNDLYLDPANRNLTVRVLVTGTRVRVYVDDFKALDYTGIDRPSGGGYTSFWADRHVTVPGGTLGFLQAEVLEPGASAEIHIDADGTIWITLHQDQLLAGAFDASSFWFLIDDTLQLGYTEFLTFAWPTFISKVESISTSHVTFGLDLPLAEGTKLAALYKGRGEEVFVPWW